MAFMPGILWSHGRSRILAVMYLARQRAFGYRKIWKYGLVPIRVEPMDIWDMISHGIR